MRKQIAAANWKMNCTFEQGEALITDIMADNLFIDSHQEVIFAVPFPYLVMAFSEVADEINLYSAAQNCHHKESGAYTGEISAEMIKSVNAHYCIVGHSERREYFNETNDVIAEKINRLFEHNIKPIFCCGEPLQIREQNTQNTYVEKQLQESLFHLSAEQAASLVIAYEPIWAIGTGKTATTEQAQEMHRFIRSVMAAKYGNDIAERISILYGGSVKAGNAAELFACPDVDGGLVGGASLVAADFRKIIDGLKKAK